MTTIVKNNNPKDLAIPAYGLKRYVRGNKMAVAQIAYKGDKEYIRISYRIGNGNPVLTYQPVQSQAKTAAGAMRKIKSFFRSLEGVTATHEI